MPQLPFSATPLPAKDTATPGYAACPTCHKITTVYKRTTVSGSSFLYCSVCQGTLFRVTEGLGV